MTQSILPPDPAIRRIGWREWICQRHHGLVISEMSIRVGVCTNGTVAGDRAGVPPWMPPGSRYETGRTAVWLLYRRNLEDMPADLREIGGGRRGVGSLNGSLRSGLRDGRVERVVCQRMECRGV
jgi:hypothetical protein